MSGRRHLGGAGSRILAAATLRSGANTWLPSELERRTTMTRSLLFAAACLAISGGAARGPALAAVQGFEVAEATIAEMQAAMEAGTVTSVGLVDAYLARIAAYDQRGPALNAIVLLNPAARERAAALDEERRTQGPRGPLHGIPIILKDNYDTADMPTTASSVALAGFVPARDGAQVRKLREAGAVIIAKSNLHEMAMGITTISSLGGQTLNPYDLTRNPGGSSGGTGAAIAASFAAVGMGSDTCGSIRIPASQNNLVGLRPTKGLSSIAGIIPLSHTQDVGGPLARTVEDLAVVLDATVGYDPDDPATTIVENSELPSFTASLDAGSLTGARFGRLDALFESSGAESAVVSVIEAAIGELAAAGAEIVPVTIPGLAELTDKASVINYEFKHDFIDYLAANPGAPVASLADLLDRGLYHEALDARFRLRERVGTRDGADYLAALQWRTILRDAVVQAMDDDDLDALLYPTLVAAPSRVDEPQRGSNCALAPNSGLPAISVPAGFTEDLLPVGLEMLGRPLSDTALVSFAYAFEQRTGHRRPPTVTPPLIAGAAPEPYGFGTRVWFTSPDGTGSRPGVDVSFTFDPLRNTLEYHLLFDNVRAEHVHAATLHVGRDGPAFARLAAPRTLDSAGAVMLTPRQHAAFLEREVYLRIFTEWTPDGGGPLALPFQIP